jgi:hypothetical protein
MLRILRSLCGFTVDREVSKGVYEYAEDEGAPVGTMVSAAEGLWGVLVEE